MQDAKKADGDKMRDSPKTEKKKKRKEKKSIWKLALSSLLIFTPFCYPIKCNGCYIGKGLTWENRV